MRYPLLAAVAAALAAVLLAGAGFATPAGTSWTRITDPNLAGDELGLARTPDGTLHVIWDRGLPPTSAIFDTRFRPNGTKLGTTTVTGSWPGAKNGLALLVMPDKSLRLFISGGHAGASSSSGISTFTAPESGASWTLQQEVWGGPVAGAAGFIGATLTKDGQVVTGWAGAAAVGIPPSSNPQMYIPFNLATRLATDAASGAVVIEGNTGAGKGGVYVQQILPSAGKATVLPFNGYNNNWIAGLSARIGAPGVYVAYADTKSVRLVRYGGGTRVLARGPYTSATVCAGPAGRLWLAWGDSKNQLFVTRSSRAVGALEPVQKLTLPQQATNGYRYLQCEGSAGPLDLFAQVADKTNGLAFWHTHLLARLTARAAVRERQAAVVVRDAGDPVAGAAVAVGGKHATTAANGRATFTLEPGSYTAKVSAPDYAQATISFTVG